MKVKQQPADFRVEELTDVIPAPGGDFAFYRLVKVGWTTPDALTAIRRRWKIEPARLSFGGLKDKHADTSQYFTILRGPARSLTHEGLRVTHLGQVREAYSAQHITANRFTITVRHLTADGERQALASALEAERLGVPNYFDDQRFGSVGRDGAFVARELVHGRFEAALKLALTGEYEHDRTAQKREKEMLRRHWGDWPACKAALPRSLGAFLMMHPTDFRGAVARLRPELGGLYLAAYQSHLWNRMLDRWLREAFPVEALGVVQLRLGEFAVPLREVEGWRELTLPLLSARLKADPRTAWHRVAEAVLADEGLTLEQMKIPGLSKPFFSKGERAACLRPVGLSVESGDDELNRGRRTVVLRFELPRGCYATMIVKRITAIRSPTA